MTYHVVPSRNDRLHVQVAREKGHNAIGNNLAIFNKNASKVADHGWIISDFESGTNCNLVTSSGNDLDLWSAEQKGEAQSQHTNGRKALRVSVMG
jgi:hypothetical protein